MFKKGDIVKVVDFSRDYPDTPIDQLQYDHPYRKFGEGECIVVDAYSRRHVTIEHIESGARNSIYVWRCVLAKSVEPDWEV